MKYSRRSFVQKSIFGIAGIQCMSNPIFADQYSSEEYFMPDEGAPHTRTWMAFGADQDIWGQYLFSEVQKISP